MCPTKLADPLTLEASGDPEDWGVCSKDCNLKHYRTNQQIYDQVGSRIVSPIGINQEQCCCELVFELLFIAPNVNVFVIF